MIQLCSLAKSLVVLPNIGDLLSNCHSLAWFILCNSDSASSKYVLYHFLVSLPCIDSHLYTHQPNLHHLTMLSPHQTLTWTSEMNLTLITVPQVCFSCLCARSLLHWQMMVQVILVVFLSWKNCSLPSSQSHMDSKVYCRIVNNIQCFVFSESMSNQGFDWIYTTCHSF